jgi:hypothetical protein
MSPLPARYVAPRQLLARLLDEPDLVAAVQALPAAALGNVIDHIGLEDAGEIVALATTEQLRRIFDEDLWRRERPGQDETFDADRFALWLEVMLEAGEAFAAGKLAELPEDFVTLALHKNVLVVNIEQMAMAMASGYGGKDDRLVEKALESCLCEELDEYRIISRQHDGWDAILSVLLALDRDHHDFLARVLDRLCAMTADYADERGGLHHVLSSQEMLEEDAAGEREDRRSEEGYVAPSSAASFLTLARTTPLDEILQATKPDPLTAAYFRAWTRPITKPASPASETEVVQAKQAAAASRRLLAILRDSDVLPRPATAGLLETADAGDTTANHFAAAMAALRTSAPEMQDRRMQELAYVTQVLLAGCTFEGRGMRPLEAARAAMATVNLGIEHGLADATAEAVVRLQSVDTLFRVGWHLLFRDVVMPAARALEQQLKTSGAAHQADALGAAVKRGKPWSGLPGVRAMGLDTVESKTLLALSDECPTLRDLLAQPPGTTGDVAYVASRAQLQAVRDFLATC